MPNFGGNMVVKCHLFILVPSCLTCHSLIRTCTRIEIRGNWWDLSHVSNQFYKWTIGKWMHWYSRNIYLFLKSELQNFGGNTLYTVFKRSTCIGVILSSVSKLQVSGTCMCWKWMMSTSTNAVNVSTFGLVIFARDTFSFPWGWNHGWDENQKNLCF